MELEESAGAIIFRKEPCGRTSLRRGKKEKIYYLLLYESNSKYWGFPKGRIEKREELRETVKREVKEETNIKDIEFYNGFKEKIDYFYREKAKKIYKTVIFFLAETKTEKVRLSFEHTGFKWLSYEKALEKLTYKNSKEILKKAKSFVRE